MCHLTLPLNAAKLRLDTHRYYTPILTRRNLDLLIQIYGEVVLENAAGALPNPVMGLPHPNLLPSVPYLVRFPPTIIKRNWVNIFPSSLLL